jgi:small subunit ribosomal protein S17
MPKRVAEGVVTSDKMVKTRRVEIDRRVRHPLYGKYIRRKTICYVHDEDETSRVGDRVEIVECRPLSKQKRWSLVRVVEKSRQVDVAALRARGAIQPAAPAAEERADQPTESPAEQAGEENPADGESGSDSEAGKE